MTEPKRVLVVDDDEGVRELVAATLVVRGMIAEPACDGGAAIDALRHNRYAVVLLDLLMPGVDGFAVIDWIGRHRTAMASQPVLIVTTGAEPYDSVALDPQTVHGIVRKPFDADELADLVVACAEVKSRGALGTMALAAFVSGAPLLALLSRF